MKYWTETDHQFLLAGNRYSEIREKFGACYGTVFAITDWGTTKILYIRRISFAQPEIVDGFLIISRLYNFSCFADRASQNNLSN